MTIGDGRKTKEVLIAQVIGVIAAPLSNLVGTIQEIYAAPIRAIGAVADKAAEGAPATAKAEEPTAVAEPEPEQTAPESEPTAEAPAEAATETAEEPAQEQ